MINRRRWCVALTVQFECDEQCVADAIDAVRRFIRGKPRIYEARALPDSPERAKEFEARAQAIAKAIKPREGQKMRRETLLLVLSGGDTWFDQGGDPDPALRNATGALSKALRQFEPYTPSPLDILAERQRETFEDGLYKGRYRGTRYRPTRLGQRVLEILRSWGSV